MIAVWGKNGVVTACAEKTQTRISHQLVKYEKFGLKTE